MLTKLNPYFDKIFSSNKNSRKYFFSPGHINILGEHVAFNGGNVLKAAVNYGFYAVTAPCAKAELTVYELNRKVTFRLNLNKPAFQKQAGELNHAAALLHYLLKNGLKPKGLNILLYSTLPAKAGFFSTAAIQVLFYIIFQTYYQLDYTLEKSAEILCKLGQKYFKLQQNRSFILPGLAAAENQYMLIDCNDFRYKNVPDFKTSYGYIMINTGIRGDDVNPELKKREEKVQSALRKIQTRFPKIKKISQIAMEEFENCFDLLDNLEQKRSMHIVTECHRVREVITAIKNKELFTIGKNMYASHISLKNDYNVSCPEIDLLVDLTKQHKATLGAKLCGSSFGGSVLVLVDKNSQNDYITTVKNKYLEKTNKKLQFLPIVLHNGAKQDELIENNN